VKGDLHQLIVGTFGTKKLYTLELGDVASTMNLIGNHTAGTLSSWIALSVSNPLTVRFTSYSPSTTRRTFMVLHLRPHQLSPHTLKEMPQIFFTKPLSEQAHFHL
jgi:hypothetical protein